MHRAWQGERRRKYAEPCRMVRFRRSTNDVVRVQVLGILRLQQCFLQATRRADLGAPFDSDDTMVPPSLDHLTVNASGTHKATDHREVKREAIRGAFGGRSRRGRGGDGNRDGNRPDGNRPSGDNNKKSD